MTLLEGSHLSVQPSGAKTWIARPFSVFYLHEDLLLHLALTTNHLAKGVLGHVYGMDLAVFSKIIDLK